MSKPQKSCEDCKHRYWVKASPYGTSTSGWGCRATGGHAITVCSLFESVAPVNPPMTTTTNLPAGVMEAIRSSLVKSAAFYPNELLLDAAVDELATALAPFWPVQNTEWANRAEAFVQWLDKDYFWPGGLFNPELANHQVVSMKLMEIRDFLAKLAHAPTPVPSVPPDDEGKRDYAYENELMEARDEARAERSELAARNGMLDLELTALRRERDGLRGDKARLEATVADLLEAHEKVYKHERWACMEQAVERARTALRPTTNEKGKTP